MSRLPISTNEVNDAAAAEYLEALAGALEDGKIVGDEAKALAKVAGRGGKGAEQIRGLNERFLELMREAAFADQVLTVRELTALRRAADALAVPDYFDDLQASVRQTNVPAGQEPDSSAQAPKPRKCGHRRTPGHYRSKYPELN